MRNWVAGLSSVVVALVCLTVWAEINRREAVAQRELAERNFAVAKQGANSLIFDIAQSLRNQEGMRTETVRKILGSSEQVSLSWSRALAKIRNCCVVRPRC